MLIAIDFDNTLTRKCELWIRFLESAEQAGVGVVCVTSRRDTPENRDELERWMSTHHVSLPIYFTGLKSKTDHMAKLGVKVDVWIDDDPVTLVRGH